MDCGPRIVPLATSNQPKFHFAVVLAIRSESAAISMTLFV